METIRLPELKKGLQSATLCAWLVEEGDAVRKGDAICEVEADKVVCPIEAEFDGIFVRALAEEGDEVAVGAPMAEAERAL